MRRLTDMIRDWAGRRRADAAIASTAAEPTPIDDLRDFIRREVAGGFYDDDAVLRNAVEVHEGEIEPALLRSEAQRLLRITLAEHRLAQSGWPTHTDCDRLDAAFEALETSGIVSRQNFTCCGTCGVAEIGAEIEDAEAAGQIVRGYTFYHAQDTEAAVDGGGLYLNYGAVEDDPNAARAIGRAIAAELTAHGLEASWDGDLKRRIAVTLSWQRRR